MITSGKVGLTEQGKNLLNLNIFLSDCIRIELNFICILLL